MIRKARMEEIPKIQKMLEGSARKGELLPDLSASCTIRSGIFRFTSKTMTGSWVSALSTQPGRTWEKFDPFSSARRQDDGGLDANSFPGVSRRGRGSASNGFLC